MAGLFLVLGPVHKHPARATMVAPTSQQGRPPELVERLHISLAQLQQVPSTVPATATTTR